VNIWGSTTPLRDSVKSKHMQLRWPWTGREAIPEQTKQREKS
jgi:hypothetical protein